MNWGFVRDLLIAVALVFFIVGATQIGLALDDYYENQQVRR